MCESRQSFSPVTVRRKLRVDEQFWGDPCMVELVMSAACTLNDVKRLSGVSRCTWRARWPFETLSGHVTIREMMTRRTTDELSDVTVGRVAEAAKLSDGAIGAMVEQLSAYRALMMRGGVLRGALCDECSATLKRTSVASAARAAFSLGYACVRSEDGWANSHAIIGACAHAALAAIAFSDPDEPSRARGWAAREACSWALVQLLSVAKKRHSCKSLVTQLRQLGVVRSCSSVLLSTTSSEALRELAAQLLYLTSTGDDDYIEQVAQCPLEELAIYACDFSESAKAASVFSLNTTQNLLLSPARPRFSAPRTSPTTPQHSRTNATAVATPNTVTWTAKTEEATANFYRIKHAAQFAVTQGLQLPHVARKTAFAVRVVADARAAVAKAASQSGAFDERSRDAIATLALMADSCPEELVAAEACEVCAQILDLFCTSKSQDFVAVGDTAAALEQFSLFYTELDAAGTREDGEDADESLHARAMAPVPPAAAYRALARVASLSASPAPDAWLRCADAVAALVASLVEVRKDASTLLSDERAVEALVHVEVTRKAHALERTDDERFYFGADRSDLTVFGVLSYCTKVARGRAIVEHCAGGRELLRELDAAPDEEDLQSDDEENLQIFPGDMGDDDDDDDDDDDSDDSDDDDSDGDDDDDEDDDNVFIIVDESDEEDEDANEAAENANEAPELWEQAPP